MGYMRHHAIVVTCFGEKIEIAHKKAKEIIGDELVSAIIDSPINGYKSFFICPDGSKEYWNESDKYEARRTIFIGWLKHEDNYSYNWALIQYGDEDGENSMIECS